MTGIPGHPPFIIAELSGNHNPSLARALAIVEAAAEPGARGLKIQTYTADTMTLDLAEGEFFISDPNRRWAGCATARRKRRKSPRYTGARSTSCGT